MKKTFLSQSFKILYKCLFFFVTLIVIKMAFFNKMSGLLFFLFRSAMNSTEVVNFLRMTQDTTIAHGVEMEAGLLCVISVLMVSVQHAFGVILADQK